MKTIRICSIEGCGRKHECKGLCGKHYRDTPEAKANKAAYEATPEAKASKSAYRSNPEYKAKQKTYHKARNVIPEVKARQKAYNSTPEVRAKQKAHNATPERKAKNANRLLLKNYGITLEQKQAMFDAQEGKCFIKGCSYIFKDIFSACVDHNHRTGKVRKLLCDPCNHALGLIKENFDTALDMAKYIQEDQGII